VTAQPPCRGPKQPPFRPWEPRTLESSFIAGRQRAFSRRVIPGYLLRNGPKEDPRCLGRCNRAPTLTGKRGASCPQAAPCGFPTILPLPPVDNFRSERRRLEEKGGAS